MIMNDQLAELRNAATYLQYSNALNDEEFMIVINRACSLLGRDVADIRSTDSNFWPVFETEAFIEFVNKDKTEK
jgi:hypothetical protein